MSNSVVYVTSDYCLPDDHVGRCDALVHAGAMIDLSGGGRVGLADRDACPGAQHHPGALWMLNMSALARDAAGSDE